MQLADNEVHLWLTDLQTVDNKLIPEYRGLMSLEELERNGRYRFESGRFADCVTRALARTVLSRYADAAPAEWQFHKGEHGKPEISAPAPAVPLRFNLSHSKRYVVCAVAITHDLGVDIECIERRNEVLDIAHRYFSEREVADLFALPEERRKQRFFDYWTLKEAYMKASGEGLSLGLGNFSFYFPGGGDIRIGFGEALEDDPGSWRFHLLQPAPEHRLAVAVRSGAAAQYGLRLFRTIPLTDVSNELDITKLSLEC